MNVPKWNFHIRQARYRYEDSRELDRSSRVLAEVLSAKVTCRTCGHEWMGRARTEAFSNVMGGVRVVCSKCGADEMRPADSLLPPPQKDGA